MSILCTLADTGANVRGCAPSYPILTYLESRELKESQMQLAILETLDNEITKAKQEKDKNSQENLRKLKQERRELLDRMKLKRRATRPLVLNPEMRAAVMHAIDYSPHQRKYTSGVIAYSEEDTQKLRQNPDIEREFRERFEEYIFAGIGKKDRLIYWVRHTDKGKIENHFVIPNLILSTGRQFNPIPPGTEWKVNLIRDYMNLKYHLSDPSDPARRRLVKHISKHDGMRKVKKIAYDNVIRKINEGGISQYTDVIRYLRTDEFTKATKLRWVEGKSRVFHKYIHMETLDGKSVRLQGFIFTDKYTPGYKFPSRVADAKIDAQTRWNTLEKWQGEIVVLIRRRSQSTRERCYPQQKPKLERSMSHCPPELPNIAHIEKALRRFNAMVPVHSRLEVPVISSHMADWEKEQVIAAQKSALAYIESKRLREKLSFLEHLELYQAIAEQFERGNLYAGYFTDPPRNDGVVEVPNFEDRIRPILQSCSPSASHAVREKLRKSERKVAYLESIRAACRDCGRGIRSAGQIDREEGHLRGGLGSLDEIFQRATDMLARANRSLGKASHHVERQVAKITRRRQRSDGLTP